MNESTRRVPRPVKDFLGKATASDPIRLMALRELSIHRPQNFRKVSADHLRHSPPAYRLHHNGCMPDYLRFFEETNARDGETYRRDHPVLKVVADDVNPGLTMFDLGYRDTDHHVRQLVVGAMTNDGITDDRRSFLLELSDQDHDSLFGTTDFVSMRAGYMHLPDPYCTADSYGKATGVSSGRTGNSMAIPRLGEDQVFVLRGFGFRGQKKRNHHIREIAVRHNAGASTIDVDFIDNSPRDDEYFIEVHYYVLNAFCRPRSLNYCLVPVSDEFQFRGETTRPKARRGHGMLAGFRFRFDRSDRHLARIAIDVRGKDSIYTSFGNRSGRHLVNAVVDYVVWESN